LPLLIEQAIFTSARTNCFDGYHLVATSGGIEPADARDLARWGPTHDSLIDADSGQRSINFHPLAGGAFCVSVTTAAGAEYSRRSGRRIYTQCLVLSPEAMDRFANNPFRVVEAASAVGQLKVLQEVPPVLEPFQLSGRASAVNRSALLPAAGDDPPEKLAAVMHLALSTAALGIAGALQSERFFDRLLNLLPVECRTAFSFSTGLRYSPRRPFRWISLSDDPSEARRVARQSGLAVVHLNNGSLGAATPWNGWAQLMHTALASDHVSALGELLNQRRPGLSENDLDALGRELLEQLAPVGAAAGKADDIRHAHAPHERFEKSQEPAVPARTSRRSARPRLDLRCGPLLEKLDQLDDAVFDAIDGDTAALDLIRRMWPEILNELDPQLVEESREQYIRYAIEAWQGLDEAGGSRDPGRAIAVLDVLAALFEGP